MTAPRYDVHSMTHGVSGTCPPVALNLTRAQVLTRLNLAGDIVLRMPAPGRAVYLCSAVPRQTYIITRSNKP